MASPYAVYVLQSLKKAYPGARVGLCYKTPLQLLVATILSAQCTDMRVNIVTKDLFKKYKTVDDFACAKQATFEKAIHSTGFYRNKAKNIVAAARKIKKEFKGKVPRTMDELITLPGVARKTANIVLFNAFGKREGIAVDTHVRRVSFRLGLTKHTDPVKIEQDLMTIVPQKDWGVVTDWIIAHGRNRCDARKPQCGKCPLAQRCPWKKEHVHAD